MTKLALISDTHGEHIHLDVPECDVLIHAGDFTKSGTKKEFIDFFYWFVGLKQATRKVFIAGNHDFYMFNNRSRPQEFPFAGYPEVSYLYNSSVSINGLHIYGTPWTPYYYDWAFNGIESKNKEGYDYRGGPGIGCSPDRDHPLLSDIYSLIPSDLDILVCHGPPIAVGGISKNLEGYDCGSVELAKAIKEKQPKYLVCGHIHEGRGSALLGNTTCLNVSSLDRHYKKINPPVIIEL